MLSAHVRKGGHAACERYRQPGARGETETNGNEAKSHIEVYNKFQLSKIPIRFISVKPAPTHFHGSSPLFEHLITLFLGDIRLEDHAILLVDFFQFVEFFPDVDCEPSRDGCSEGRCLTHGWTIHGNSDNIGLGLISQQSVTCFCEKGIEGIVAYLPAYIDWNCSYPRLQLIRQVYGHCQAP